MVAVGEMYTGSTTTTPSMGRYVDPRSSSTRLVESSVSGLPQSYQPSTGNVVIASPRSIIICSASVVDIKALLGHESSATTQIDTHVGQEWMEQGVARW